MLEFKEYQSKPITRKAHQVTQEDIDTATEMPIYRGRPSNRHIKIKGKMISRIPLQAVRVGDYIVRDGCDFHLCAKDVFEAGNVMSNQTVKHVVSEFASCFVIGSSDVVNDLLMRQIGSLIQADPYK